jgi:hypothetical protein
MPPCKVDKFSVQLSGRQGHDRAGRVELHRAQSPVQPHGSILKDIVGVFPAANAGKAGEHPVGQFAEAACAEFDDPIPGGKVTPLQPLETFRQVCRDRVVASHGTLGAVVWAARLKFA